MTDWPVTAVAIVFSFDEWSVMVHYAAVAANVAMVSSP
jgi:hypothetical protein